MSYEKIELAIKSGLLSEDMCEIVIPPTRGEINEFQNKTGHILSEGHFELLLKWGGSNLDEIRINSLKNTVCANGYIEFANDYNGFIYKYNSTGKVCVEDTDGGEVTPLAASVSEFINDIFLGELGIEFYGQDWVAELKVHGLA